MAKKKKKKKGSKKVVLFVFEILLLLVVLGALALYNSTIGKIDFKKQLTTSEAGVNDDIKEETVQTMHGYLNVALFGLDTRKSGDYSKSNSDCIMIASLNYDTNEVQLISVYRDTYLAIGKGKYAKANAAYANGGAENSVKMINSNLDLDITKYVCVDWKALIEVIDKLGGIDLDITDAEVVHINNYMKETSKTTDVPYDEVTESGHVHLSGIQAVAYCRIRYTTGDDFMRTSRQRIVLQELLKKAKEADIATLTSMCSVMMDDISTNFSVPELVSLAKGVTKYNVKSTTGFPFYLTTKDLAVGSSVVPVDFENNVIQLHQFLFGDEAYTPSETVSAISSNIEKKTGVLKDEATIDTSRYNETVGAEGSQGVMEQNKDKKKIKSSGSDSEDNSSNNDISKSKKN